MLSNFLFHCQYYMTFVFDSEQKGIEKIIDILDLISDRTAIYI